MENLINKIFKSAKQVRLEKEKKNSIKGEILMFMKENPCPPAGRHLSLEQAKPSFWSIIFSPKFRPAYITVSSLALVLFITGTISVNAQSALPGDPLYPVKVDFNEKILQVLAFSDEAKTKLSMDLVQVRLQEAEKIAVQGKMTKKNQEQINNNITVHADAVTKSIEKLSSEKKYNTAQKVASDLEASLKAHSQTLEKIQQIKEKSAEIRKENRENIEKIKEKVDQRIQEIRDKVKNKTKD